MKTILRAILASGIDQHTVLWPLISYSLTRTYLSTRNTTRFWKRSLLSPLSPHSKHLINTVSSSPPLCKQRQTRCHNCMVCSKDASLIYNACEDTPNWEEDLAAIYYCGATCPRERLERIRTVTQGVRRPSRIVPGWRYCPGHALDSVDTRGRG